MIEMTRENTAQERFRLMERHEADQAGQQGPRIDAVTHFRKDTGHGEVPVVRFTYADGSSYEFDGRQGRHSRGV